MLFSKTAKKMPVLQIFFFFYCLILGAWIIIVGMNTGIMKLVDEIIQINSDRSRPISLIVNFLK